MRRIIVTQLLSGAALHLFCSECSLLIDCDEDGAFPVPAETIERINAGEGEFRRVLMRLSTSVPSFNREMTTVTAGNVLDRLCAGPFSVTSIAAGDCSPYHISVDGFSLLVCGSATANVICKTAALLPKPDVLFLSAETMASPEGFRAVTEAGASSVFVCRYLENGGKLERELTRKASRLARKGFRLHLMKNTPAGFLL